MVVVAGPSVPLAHRVWSVDCRLPRGFCCPSQGQISARTHMGVVSHRPIQVPEPHAQFMSIYVHSQSDCGSHKLWEPFNLSDPAQVPPLDLLG